VLERIHETGLIALSDGYMYGNGLCETKNAGLAGTPPLPLMFDNVIVSNGSHHGD